MTEDYTPSEQSTREEPDRLDKKRAMKRLKLMEKGRALKHEAMIYTRYERFWHWSQAILVFTLLFTGFGLHGWHNMLYFGTAVKIHTVAAVLLIALWVFTTFWNFTTGQWKQYLIRGGVKRVIRFYLYGMLVGEPHPYKKSLQRKQNALQSLAYLSFMVLIGPALWASGVAYLLYDLWDDYTWALQGLQFVAFIHTGAAFLMAAFVIVHVYMTTTGKTVFHYLKTMITGYDNIEMTEVEEAYYKETNAVPMKD